MSINKNRDSFRDLLRRVNAELRLAYEHQEFDWTYHLMPEVYSDVDFNWIRLIG